MNWVMNITPTCSFGGTANPVAGRLGDGAGEGEGEREGDVCILRLARLGDWDRPLTVRRKRREAVTAAMRRCTQAINLAAAWGARPSPNAT
jgi:hypothetical protein